MLYHCRAPLLFRQRISTDTHTHTHTLTSCLYGNATVSSAVIFQLTVVVASWARLLRPTHLMNRPPATLYNLIRGSSSRAKGVRSRSRLLNKTNGCRQEQTLRCVCRRVHSQNRYSLPPLTPADRRRWALCSVASIAHTCLAMNLKAPDTVSRTRFSLSTTTTTTTIDCPFAFLTFLPSTVTTPLGATALLLLFFLLLMHTATECTKTDTPTHQHTHTHLYCTTSFSLSLSLSLNYSIWICPTLFYPPSWLNLIVESFWSIKLLSLFHTTLSSQLSPLKAAPNTHPRRHSHTPHAHRYIEAVVMKVFKRQSQLEQGFHCVSKLTMHLQCPSQCTSLAGDASLLTPLSLTCT